jgi:hypothetical protein
MYQVAVRIGLSGVPVHVRVTRTAQQDQVIQSIGNLIIAGTSDAFNLSVVNIRCFP